MFCSAEDNSKCNAAGRLNSIFLFSSALILADGELSCKAEKENGVTARRSSLPLSESLSAKSPHFLFSDLELKALVPDENKAALGVGCGYFDISYDYICLTISIYGYFSLNSLITCSNGLSSNIISECELTAKKHVTSTHKVNVQTFEIEEADINAISSILNYDNLNSYNGLADKDKTELGYRDGWRTEYKVYYCNGQCLSGKLSIIFEESPLEQTIRLLREKYPYIEVVQHI